MRDHPLGILRSQKCRLDCKPLVVSKLEQHLFGTIVQAALLAGAAPIARGPCRLAQVLWLGHLVVVASGDFLQQPSTRDTPMRATAAHEANLEFAFLKEQGKHEGREKQIMYHVSCITYHVSCIIHQVSCSIYHASSIMRHLSCTISSLSCVICHVSCVIYHVSSIMYHGLSIMTYVASIIYHVTSIVYHLACTIVRDGNT